MYANAEASEVTAAEASRAERGKQTRGNDRRELLLQTTLRLIASEGIDAVSHRSVAELAGVPLGSTTYWFASRQEMLREALVYFTRLEMDDLRERLAGVLGKRPSRKRLADEFTEFLRPQLDEERWRTMATYSLAQEAARQPELLPACREWAQAWKEVLTEVFSSLGARSPELEADMFLALLDGLLLGELIAPSEDVDQSPIRPALRAWFSRVPTE